MQFCGECGAQVEDGALFCDECGAKIESEEPINTTEEPITSSISTENENSDNTAINQKKRRNPLPVLLLCLVAIGIGTYFVLGNRAPKTNSVKDSANLTDSSADDLDINHEDTATPENADDSFHLTMENLADFCGTWVSSDGSKIEIKPDYNSVGDYVLTIYRYTEGTQFCEWKKEENITAVNSEKNECYSSGYGGQKITFTFEEGKITADGKKGIWPQNMEFTLQKSVSYNLSPYDYYGFWIGDKGSCLEITPMYDYSTGAPVQDTTSASITIYLNDAEYDEYAEYATYTVEHEELFLGNDYYGTYEFDGYEVSTFFTFLDQCINADNSNSNNWPYDETFTQQGYLTPEGSDEISSYHNDVPLRVIEQYTDGTNTYLIAYEYGNSATSWIVMIDGTIEQDYMYQYLISGLTFYPNMYFKGYPLCKMDPNIAESVSYYD